MDTWIEAMRSTLKKYGQEHLEKYYQQLDEEKRKILLNQIEGINFELIANLYNNTKKGIKQNQDEITPIDYLDKYKLYDDYKHYENIGEKAIREGKLAVVTMAGGQGTRLGHNGPKGTYDIGLESHKSLFELLGDYIKEQEKKYNVTIPWFIMTSKENDKQTQNFFENKTCQQDTKFYKKKMK